MKDADKRNLFRAWPFYIIMIAIIGYVFWYYRTHPGSGEVNTEQGPLANSIARSLDPTGLKQVIAERKGWDPVMPETWNKPAPAMSVADVEGNPVQLADLAGKNVILVFWATWCPPCNMEIPHLKELREEIPEEDLAILALSNEDAATVRPFVERKEINYTVAAEVSNLPRPFDQVRSIPTSFYIDREGMIRMAAVGVVPTEDAQAILKVIASSPTEEASEPVAAR